MTAFDAPLALLVLAGIPLLWVLWRLRSREAVEVSTLSLLRKVADRDGRREGRWRLPPASFWAAALGVAGLALGGAGLANPAGGGAAPAGEIALSADPSILARAGDGRRLEWILARARKVLDEDGSGRDWRLEADGASERLARPASAILESLRALKPAEIPGRRAGEAAVLPWRGAGPRWVFTTGEGPPGAARADETPGVPNACVLSVEGTPAGAFVRVANFSGAAWRGRVTARRPLDFPRGPEPAEGGAAEAGDSLEIRPGEIAAAALPLPPGPGGIVAEIRSGAPDGFPEDDRLEVAGGGAGAEVSLRGSVPSDLRAALEATPEARKPLVQADATAPGGPDAIPVWASADPTANPAGPFLWVHPREGSLGVRRLAPDAPAGRFTRQDTEEPALRGIDLTGADPGPVAKLALPASFRPVAWAGDTPVIAFTPGPPAGYLVAADLERSPWTGQATFPVFVRQALLSLLSLAPGRASSARDPAASDLRAPLALYREAGAPAPSPPVRPALAAPLFALALAAFAAAWALESRGK